MKKLFSILFVFSTFFGNSQNFEYQFLFEGIGDNREYFNDYGFPQTILGTRAAIEAGTSFGEHKVRFGVSQLFEFGSYIGAQKPRPIIYYQFSNPKNKFLFGAFPRRDKLDFPLAMLTDTFLYYRPNIEGIYGKTSWNWGWQNAFIDWVSRQTAVDEEIFMAGATGEISYKQLFLQHYLLMTHDSRTSSREEYDHIKDFLGFAVQSGVRTAQTSKIQGYGKAGFLTSTYRQRSITDGYIVSTSFFAEAKFSYKRMGIKSVLNAGGGHNFSYGDRFYRAENYFRTDFIWTLIDRDHIRGTFNYSFHVIDWAELNQQQQLSIIYIFGN